MGWSVETFVVGQLADDAFTAQLNQLAENDSLLAKSLLSDGAAGPALAGSPRS